MFSSKGDRQRGNYGGKSKQSREQSAERLRVQKDRGSTKFSGVGKSKSNDHNGGSRGQGGQPKR